MADDEMVGGHEFQQTPGDSGRQGSLACYSPWGHKELDMTDRMKNKHHFIFNNIIRIINYQFARYIAYLTV